MIDKVFDSVIKINQLFENNKKIFIFGTGVGGKTTFFVLKNLSLSPFCFVDNNQSLTGSTIFDIPINIPSYLLNEDKEKIIILVASMYYREISKQLNLMGFQEDIHYFYALNYQKPLLPPNLQTETMSFWNLSGSYLNVSCYQNI